MKLSTKDLFDDFENAKAYMAEWTLDGLNSVSAYYKQYDLMCQHVHADMDEKGRRILLNLLQSLVDFHEYQAENKLAENELKVTS